MKKTIAGETGAAEVTFTRVFILLKAAFTEYQERCRSAQGKKVESKKGIWGRAEQKHKDRIEDTYAGGGGGTYKRHLLSEKVRSQAGQHTGVLGRLQILKEGSSKGRRERRSVFQRREEKKEKKEKKIF